MAANGQVAVTLVACGLPTRSMGWYHAKQILDGRVPGAQLVNIVEPFFLGPVGSKLESAKEFSTWAAETAKGVALHATIPEMPAPTGANLIIICGRTADNPKLFKEAIDRGFTHIYLEKPGAPTVAELEEMDAYAKSKGVGVSMGFNRNFSKYVLMAKDMFAHAPAGALIKMGRNDAFNTPEALDECFERNAEGMLKNMMIHEIVALISHFGLRADDIDKIEPDTKYTVHEIRKGVTDFSRIGCTLLMKSGQNIALWGDRCDGEYADFTISSPGMKITTMRPDPQLSKEAAELEAATPGCPPFFYIQDGEYLLLKEKVVQHVQAGEKGTPPGVCTIEIAIEGLKLCDMITKALVRI